MQVKHLGQICVGPTLSDEDLKKVKAALRADKTLGQHINTHQLLSGETRYKLVKLLKELKELCVCDMAEILGTSVSAVSHQLRVLRKAGLVTTRRKGQAIYYSLKDKQIAKLL